MSQHDMNIANQGFPAFRSDLNNALTALASNSSGATPPSTTYANQFWYETDTNTLYFRNEDNDAWITLAVFDQTNDEWEIRTAVVQAVDSAGVSIKTDDGTSRITVLDDGSVGIGVSPSFDFHAFRSGPLNSVFESDTGNSNVRITSGDGDNAQIFFGDQTNDTISTIEHDNSDNSLNFYTGGANKRMTIDSSGDLDVNGSITANSMTLTSVTALNLGDADRIGWGDSTTRILADSTNDYFRVINTGATALEIDSSNNLQFNSGYGSVATAYGCRAWVNFDGSGTLSIREDGNVSSVTDNGAGDYTVNFGTAMPDANYCVTSTGVQRQNASASGVFEIYGSNWDGGSGFVLTSSVRLRQRTSADQSQDIDVACVAIFR